MWNFGDVSHLKSRWTNQTTIRELHKQKGGLVLYTCTTWSLTTILDLREKKKTLSNISHMSNISLVNCFTYSRMLPVCFSLTISVKLGFQHFGGRIVSRVPSSNCPKYLSCNALPKNQHTRTSPIILHPQSNT